jgi:hypothetical protein
MRSPLDTSTLILAAVAVVLAVVAYLKDPGLVSMLAFVIPGMVVALLLAGLMQVLLAATLAGVVTPRGPTVTVPSPAFPLIAGRLVSVFNHE